jgi:hypothetical protein
VIDPIGVREEQERHIQEQLERMRRREDVEEGEAVLDLSLNGITDRAMRTVHDAEEKRGRWTKHEDAVLQQNFAHFAALDNVAEVLAGLLPGRSAAAVANRLRKLGLWATRPPRQRVGEGGAALPPLLRPHVEAVQLRFEESAPRLFALVRKLLDDANRTGLEWVIQQLGACVESRRRLADRGESAEDFALVPILEFDFDLLADVSVCELLRACQAREPVSDECERFWRWPAGLTLSDLERMHALLVHARDAPSDAFSVPPNFFGPRIALPRKATAMREEKSETQGAAVSETSGPESSPVRRLAQRESSSPAPAVAPAGDGGAAPEERTASAEIVVAPRPKKRRLKRLLPAKRVAASREDDDGASDADAALPSRVEEAAASEELSAPGHQSEPLQASSPTAVAAHFSSPTADAAAAAADAGAFITALEEEDEQPQSQPAIATQKRRRIVIDDADDA